MVSLMYQAAKGLQRELHKSQKRVRRLRRLVHLLRSNPLSEETGKALIDAREKGDLNENAFRSSHSPPVKRNR